MERMDAHELQIDGKGRVHKAFSPVRFLGNLLIVGGLLLLLGVGGWQGYIAWSNNQQLSSFHDEGVVVEPTLDPSTQAGLPIETPITSAAALPEPPPPNLNPGGLVLEGWAALHQQQIDNSPTTHLTIPSVGVDSKIVPIDWKMIPGKDGAAAKSEWQVADYAVGHHAGTANPGQPGNVVLSGHDDYKGEVFKNLHDVHKGDEVIVDTEKGQYVYIITDLVLVKEEGVSDAQKLSNAAYMNPTPDQTLTMITCWPYGIDDYRFIAIAKPYQSSQSAFSEFFIR
ncbi:MAG TPA: sortase [Chloroflexia bacterium]|nr:sortase [Chloroflexia bacterium]